MNKFGFHALVLAGLMGFAAVAGAQSVQLTTAELKVKADQMGQQTFTRKNGQVLTFLEIRALPDTELEVVLDDEMSQAESTSFIAWQKKRSAAAIAKAEADSKAEIAKADVKIRADKEALDRSIAEESAKWVRNLEDLSVTIRTLVAIGGVMGRNDKILLEKSLGHSYVVANLKPETLSFLKSLLARPELFTDK